MSLIPHKIKYLFFKVLKSSSSTVDVADGLAIGVFISLQPIMGSQMLVAFLLTSLFRKNSWVAMLAAWITNPLTFVPIYLFNYWVGLYFYPEGARLEEMRRIFKSELTWQAVRDLGKDILMPLLLGSIIVGIVAAFVSRILCLKYYDRLKVRFKHTLHLPIQPEASKSISDE